MNITRTTPRTRKSQTQDQQKESVGKRIVDYVGEHPLRTLSNFADISIGGSLALDLVKGNGQGFTQGAGQVLGFAHLVSAFGNLVLAGVHSDAGFGKEAKRLAMRGVGDALTATGVLAAAYGVGPVAIGFLGAGVLTATLAG